MITLTLDSLLTFFFALVLLFSPFANIGPIASVMGGYTRDEQKKIAKRVFFNVVVVLLLFVWAGKFIFDFLGINSYALGITGGFALAVAGIPMMLHGNKHKSDPKENPKKNWKDAVTVPITFPMSIGGTTAAYIVTADNYAKTDMDLVLISLVIVLYGVVIWLAHYLSPVLSEKLSPNGRNILTSVGGIILVTIAIQLIAEGVAGFFPILVK